MADHQFTSWDFAPLRSMGTTVDSLRLQAEIEIDAADPDSGETGSAHIPFELFGAADVATLCRETIIRRFPAPGTRNAEETKVAMVELRSRDLPWRYSPDMPGPAILGNVRRVRPWIVVVAGPSEGMTLMGDGSRASISAEVLKKHPLKNSWQWAHLHVAHGEPIARIMSPYRLADETDYRVCVVPAFAVRDGALVGAWNGLEDAVLPCFDSWTFRTGEDGDFPHLAAKLRVADLDALQRRAGKALGQASIRYRRRGSGQPEATDLPAYGALRLPGAVPSAPTPAWVGDEAEALTERIVSPDGRLVLTAPRYPAPFVASATEGWTAELTRDPRYRAAAGLGAWNAIEWQNRISEAAARRVGDLAIARDRVAHLALGLIAAGSLWRRRVPVDPVDALAVLAPVLGRLPATGGTTALDEISGRTSMFTRALFSSAARRAMRPGPARTVLAADGAADPGALLRAAAKCGETPTPPHSDPRQLHDAVAGMSDDLRGQLRGAGSLERGLGIDRIVGRYETVTQWQRPCRGVEVARLGEIIADAVDPTRNPIVIERVLGTLEGVDGIGPVEIEPELDLPLWSFLAKRSPDWMLPGAGDLDMHEVVALGTNPAFVDAYLVGVNHQVLGELRWRNIPVRSGWSPLRKFWQRKSGDCDVDPIRHWSQTDPLGALSHSEANPNEEAVILFRTTLFRRYPNTVVYLYRDDDAGDWNHPDPDTALDPSRREYPTFTGSIGRDIAFFGFAVAPTAVANYWVVLEEPPAGYRFFHPSDRIDKDAVPSKTYSKYPAADFARYTFALPVRLLLAPLLETAP